MYTALIIKPNKPFSKKVILLCKKTFPKLDIFFSTNKKKFLKN